MDFARFAAVLLDLDGTLYHEQCALPGAVELVNQLTRDGRAFACLSNSATSPDLIHKNLKQMDIHIPPQRIYSAAAAVVDYVLSHFPRPPQVFNLATEGVRELLDGKCIWVNDGEQPCDVVIAGGPANVFATPDRQLIALRLLRVGAKLVGICADRMYPSPRGMEFGSGAFCAMLGYAATVKPFLCGKPEPIFFTELCDRLSVQPQHCVLIGDNLESDIAGGKKMGMKTILTLTGVARRSDLAELAPQNQPDLVIENLTELPRYDIL